MAMLRLKTNQPAGLLALGERLRDRSSLLAALAGPALEAVRENFRAGGRPTPWAPLAESTLRRRGRGATPLLDTGRLLGSIEARVRGGRLVLSTDLPYAAIHQFGGRAGRRGAAKIPARPYLVLPPEDIRRLAGVLAGELRP
jgi:phage virion morphogenesis protein